MPCCYAVTTSNIGLYLKIQPETAELKSDDSLTVMMLLLVDLTRADKVM